MHMQEKKKKIVPNRWAGPNIHAQIVMSTACRPPARIAAVRTVTPAPDPASIRYLVSAGDTDSVTPSAPLRPSGALVHMQCTHTASNLTGRAAATAAGRGHAGGSGAATGPRSQPAPPPRRAVPLPPPPTTRHGRRPALRHGCRRPPGSPWPRSAVSGGVGAECAAVAFRPAALLPRDRCWDRQAALARDGRRHGLRVAAVARVRHPRHGGLHPAPGS